LIYSDKQRQCQRFHFALHEYVSFQHTTVEIIHVISQLESAFAVLIHIRFSSLL